jgi:hypothetical protein
LAPSCSPFVFRDLGKSKDQRDDRRRKLTLPSCRRRGPSAAKETR